MIRSLVSKQVLIIVLGFVAQGFALLSLRESEYALYGALLAILVITTTADDYYYYFSLSRDNVLGSDKRNASLAVVFLAFACIWLLVVIFFFGGLYEDLAIAFLSINGVLHLVTKYHENRLVFNSKFNHVQNLTLTSRFIFVISAIGLFTLGTSAVTALLISQVVASIILRGGVVLLCAHEFKKTKITTLPISKFKSRALEPALVGILIVPFISKVCLAAIISLAQSHTAVLVGVVTDMTFSFFYLMQSYFAPTARDYRLFLDLFDRPIMMLICMIPIILLVTFALSEIVGHSLDLGPVLCLVLLFKFIEHGLQLKLRDNVVCKSQ